MNPDKTRYPVDDISTHHRSAAEAVQHAISSLDSLLAKPRFSVGQGESQVYLKLRRDMPYIIHELPLPDTRILVNRNYKPLGSNARTTEHYVKYEEHTQVHVTLTEKQIASVLSPGRTDALFGDENPPWQGRKHAEAYLARLRKLHRLLAGLGNAA